MFSAIVALTEANGDLSLMSRVSDYGLRVMGFPPRNTQRESSVALLLRILETREAVDIGQIHLPHGTVPLLSDDDLRHTPPPAQALAVMWALALVIYLVAINEQYHVGILFDGAGFAKVGKHGSLFLPGPRFDGAVQL